MMENISIIFEEAILCVSIFLAFVFAILWSKERKRRVDETNKRWQEISLHSMCERKLEKLESAQFEFDCLMDCIHEQSQAIGEWINMWTDAEARCEQLQDKLSAELCPHNNHVWVDGKCKRCGRKKTPC